MKTLHVNLKVDLNAALLSAFKTAHSAGMRVRAIVLSRNIADSITEYMRTEGAVEMDNSLSILLSSLDPSPRVPSGNFPNFPIFGTMYGTDTYIEHRDTPADMLLDDYSATFYLGN
jgi:hypothetical protein